MTDYQVLGFDCYGTLINWAAGIAAGPRPARRAGEPSPWEAQTHR
jgi:FMN phosphatase YigB (HAD superfamily)